MKTNTAQRIILYWEDKIGDTFQEDIEKGASLMKKIQEVKSKQRFIFFMKETVHGFCGDHKQRLSSSDMLCSCKAFQFGKGKPCKHLLGAALAFDKNF